MIFGIFDLYGMRFSFRSTLLTTGHSVFPSFQINAVLVNVDGTASSSLIKLQIMYVWYTRVMSIPKFVIQKAWGMLERKKSSVKSAKDEESWAKLTLSLPSDSWNFEREATISPASSRSIAFTMSTRANTDPWETNRRDPGREVKLGQTTFGSKIQAMMHDVCYVTGDVSDKSGLWSFACRWLAAFCLP